MSYDKITITPTRSVIESGDARYAVYLSEIRAAQHAYALYVRAVEDYEDELRQAKRVWWVMPRVWRFSLASIRHLRRVRAIMKIKKRRDDIEKLRQNAERLLTGLEKHDSMSAGSIWQCGELNSKNDFRRES